MAASSNPRTSRAERLVNPGPTQTRPACNGSFETPRLLARLNSAPQWLSLQGAVPRETGFKQSLGAEVQGCGLQEFNDSSTDASGEITLTADP